MEIKMEIKIKLNEEKEIVLDEAEARELYTRLKNLFDSNYTITYPSYPNYPDGTLPRNPIGSGNPIVSYKTIPCWLIH